MLRVDIMRGLLALCLLVVSTWCSAAELSACAVEQQTPAGADRVFRDASAAMTPQQIVQLPGSAYKRFVPGRYMGNSEGVWWLRLTLDNHGDLSCTRWLKVAPARVGDVSVYTTNGDNWRRMVAGAYYPFPDWALPIRQPLYPLQLSPGATTVLIKVVSHGQAFALAPKLWSPERFLTRLNHQSLSDGLVGGTIALLVLVSLGLSYLYRRPPLLYMALATALYLLHVALLRNYLFVYFWPNATGFNQWIRLFAMGTHFVALFAYLYTVVRVDRLHRWFTRLFYSAPVAFALLAVFGIFINDASIISYSIIGLYQGFIWLLAAVVVYNMITGRDRHWFAPLLIGAICLRGVVLFGQLVGLHIHFWGAEYLSAPMMLILGVFLFGTLLSQARKGRMAELHARAALDTQRATENDRLERTVAQRTEELGRSLQARRQLLGRISHDLRSPLVGMLDSVSQWRSGEERRDYPQLIERHARQQMDMIDELLEFSRTESSDLQPQAVPGYLYAFLNEVCTQAELVMERHGNQLQRDFADDLPALVSVDYHYLQRVLNNLLSNASKFTPRGLIRFRVAVGAPTAEGKALLHFSVEDSGPGITPADRERLLQPYARGRSAAQREGYGLGLAIVTQLLECMDSELHIDDAPGGGSRFHFVLAVAPATESDLEPVLEENDIIDIDGAGHAILVVDDEPQQRDIISDLFAGYGFESMAAADGAQALDIVHRHRVDLVLTDQYMQGMDGWALLRAVRDAYPELPVVVYSSVPPRPATEGVTASFDAHLLKPASGTTLMRLVNRLLAQGLPGESELR